MSQTGSAIVRWKIFDEFVYILNDNPPVVKEKSENEKPILDSGCWLNAEIMQKPRLEIRDS